jgi:hypothetical protein
MRHKTTVGIDLEFVAKEKEYEKLENKKKICRRVDFYIFNDDVYFIHDASQFT